MNPNDISLATAMDFMHAWHDLVDTRKTGNDRGNCYENTARFVLDRGEFEGTPVMLCHGMVASEETPYHGHAWVEWGDGHPLVFDPSNGEPVATIMLAGDYYHAGKIYPGRVQRYTQDMVRHMVAQYETYGPWE